MYADPTQLRRNKVTIYLNDLEADFVNSANNLMGTQKAVLLRDLLLTGVRRALQGELDVLSNSAQVEQPQLTLFGS